MEEEGRGDGKDASKDAIRGGGLKPWVHGGWSRETRRKGRADKPTEVGGGRGDGKDASEDAGKRTERGLKLVGGERERVDGWRAGQSCVIEFTFVRRGLEPYEYSIPQFAARAYTFNLARSVKEYSALQKRCWQPIRIERLYALRAISYSV